ncbi:cell division protein FtsZ homolog 2-1, chloroplastic-like [Magnolia sinica]|uniref:cell division protein FtsZ homolog 2-1, chloroplastic-like n=1 Tax=Magnolia sinica TaxID=86752 RepID=UPI00265A291C|nr:cell division protein FtsZ homolog 2-1, chloroplastic-like [Magnolia sinica]
MENPPVLGTTKILVLWKDGDTYTMFHFSFQQLEFSQGLRYSQRASLRGESSCTHHCKDPFLNLHLEVSMLWEERNVMIISTIKKSSYGSVAENLSESSIPKIAMRPRSKLLVLEDNDNFIEKSAETVQKLQPQERELSENDQGRTKLLLQTFQGLGLQSGRTRSNKKNGPQLTVTILGSLDRVLSLEAAQKAVSVGYLSCVLGSGISGQAVQAQEGIAALRDNVGPLIVIPNDKLLTAVSQSTPVTEAFNSADDIL